MFSCSGAARLGDFAVAPTGTTRQFSIAAGRAHILGAENVQQGGYVAWNDASELQVVGAPSGTPRIDTVLLRIYDSQYGTLPSGITRAQWDIIAGTPGGSPAVLPDSSFLTGGANYVPGAWWRLCDIRSNPGDTTIPANQIYPTNTFVRVPGGVTLCYSVASTTGFGGRPSDPLQGDRIYEIDTKFFYTYSGTKWLRERITLYKTANQTFVSNTTQAPVTGLSFPMEANSIYSFYLIVGINTDISGSGPGLSLGATAPASTRWDFGHQGRDWIGGGFFNGWQNNVGPNPGMGNWGGGSSSLSHTTVIGTVACGATPGVAQITAAQAFSSGIAATLYQGSKLIYEQVS